MPIAAVVQDKASLQLLPPQTADIYRMLTGQGKDTNGGAYDYLVDGRMVGGFALVAYPARYGVSGIMTLIVNHDGVVYQKDLGDDAAQFARTMATFNPDETWRAAAGEQSR